MIFFSKIPTEWEEPRYGGQNYLKVTEKRIEKFVEWGGNDFNSTWNEGKIYLKDFKTHNSGEDRIKQYSIHKVIKYHSRKKNAKERNLTTEEICEILKITSQQWNDFTTGKKSLITTDKDEPEGYWIMGAFDDKNIKIFLYLKTWGWTTEEMRIDIFENTL